MLWACYIVWLWYHHIHVYWPARAHGRPIGTDCVYWYIIYIYITLLLTIQNCYAFEKNPYWWLILYFYIFLKSTCIISPRIYIGLNDFKYVCLILVCITFLQAHCLYIGGHVQMMAWGSPMYCIPFSCCALLSCSL